MGKLFYVIIVSICGALALVALNSCSPFMVPDRTSTFSDIPESFSLGQGVSDPAQKWWLNLSSPELTLLIEEALAENLSLRVYWARLEKAQALAVRAGSGLYPAVSAEASAAYSDSRLGGGTSGSADEKRFAVGLAAGYELDLWGRVRAGAESAELTMIASLEDFNAAAMTVAAEVARRWVGILARREELLLLEQQLAANQTYLDLVELRFRKSLASALDVMQQQQLVERVQARLPLVQMQEQLLRNELALLVGRMPGASQDVQARSLPTLLSPPAGGVPAMLLENRPDVRAAFRRLQASDQDLVVARADRLPAIRLTGSASYSSSDLDRIFDNWLANLAASLAAPLLDGGRRKAEEDVASATVKERLALYRQAVLDAVQEVEGALVREEKIREHIVKAERQLQAAKTALDEARTRYVNGLNDYLPVLTQLLSVQNLEMELISRNQELIEARIALNRAVGGTWTEELQPPDTTMAPEQQDNKS